MIEQYRVQFRIISAGKACIPGFVNFPHRQVDSPKGELRRPEQGEHDGGCRFHHEISSGDRRPAIAASSAQHQPGRNGDIIEPADSMIARRTVRPRQDQTHSLRQPKYHHVQKTADHCAQNKEPCNYQNVVGLNVFHVKTKGKLAHKMDHWQWTVYSRRWTMVSRRCTAGSAKPQAVSFIIHHLTLILHPSSFILLQSPIPNL